MISLETDISKYIRSTINKPLPVKFYRPDNLSPYISSDNSLLENYISAHGLLSTEEIIMAYSMTTRDKNINTLISSIRDLGNYIYSRYNIPNFYRLYSREQYESDASHWRTIIRREKDYERLLLDKIELTNERILSYPDTMIARKEINQSNIVFDISWNASNINKKDFLNRDFNLQPIVDGGRVTLEDAIDLFTLLKITNNVPYVAYHTPSQDQYKLSSVQGSARPQRDEYTYKSITDSDLYTNLQNSSAFIAFIINNEFAIINIFQSNITFYAIKENVVSDLLESARDYLYFLNLVDEKRQRISVNFSLIGHQIIYPILYADLILNEGEYIYFKEEDTPQLQKTLKSFFISPIPLVVNPETGNYKRVGEFKVTISNHVAVNDEFITLINGKTEQLKKGTSYTDLSIVDINNTSILSFVGVILMKILGKYTKSVEEYYNTFRTDFEDILSVEISRETYMKKSANVRNFDYLHNKMPELFVKTYSRVCQNYQQPDIKEALTPKEEASGEWMKFPPGETTEFYFTCSQHKDHNPSYEYPGLKLNRKLKNRKRYPLIPCCFVLNQLTDPKSITYIAHHNPELLLTGTKAVDISLDLYSSRWGTLEYPPLGMKRTIMSEDKSLYKGRFGLLPQILESVLREVLESIGETYSNYEIYRYGLSEQTLVHAIFLAMDEVYQKLSVKSFEERDKYIREHIKLPHLEALCQEITLRNEDIQNIDPHLWTTKSHYRILEEMFNVNIFVLYRTSGKEGSDEPSKYTFEIPNSHTGYHLRCRKTDRPYVLLYKHLKFEGNVRVETPLELIIYGNMEAVSREQQSTMSAVWGTACSKLFDLYEKSYNIVSSGFSPLDLSPDGYKTYQGLFSTDYAEHLNRFEPVSQLIDEYGHCRGLNFKQEFSVIFYPTQPYNLPLGSIIRADYKYISKLLGNGNMISSVNDGVFYILGESGRYLFVPLKKTSTLPPENETIRVKYTPLSGERKGFTIKNSWSKAYSDLKILLFIFSWLYTLSNSTDPTQFMNDYVTLDESKHAQIASDIYDFSNLKRIIVLSKPDLKHGFDYLHKMIPSLFTKNNKLLVTSQKLYNSFHYFLKIVDKQISARRHTSWTTQTVRWDISHLFSIRNETQREGNLYFDNVHAVRIWFQAPSMITATDAKYVSESIKNGISVISWRHSFSGRSWLIPSKNYKLNSAIYLVWRWHQEKIVHLTSLTSEEFDAKTIEAEISTVVKYGFTYDNRIEIFEVTSYNNTGIQVEVLLSVPGRYTPLFPL